MRALLACVLLVVAGCLLGAPLAGAAAPAHGPLTVGQAHHVGADAQEELLRSLSLTDSQARLTGLTDVAGTSLR